MTTNACSEIEGKFAPEQRQLLGKGYATILRFVREDESLEKKQNPSSSTSSTNLLRSAAMLAEISRQE
jgi:hypothetical protein